MNFFIRKTLYLQKRSRKVGCMSKVKKDDKKPVLKWNKEAWQRGHCRPEASKDLLNFWQLISLYPSSFPTHSHSSAAGLDVEGLGPEMAIFLQLADTGTGMGLSTGGVLGTVELSPGLPEATERDFCQAGIPLNTFLRVFEGRHLAWLTKFKNCPVSWLNRMCSSPPALIRMLSYYSTNKLWKSCKIRPFSAL